MGTHLWEDIRWALVRRVPRRMLYWCVMQGLVEVSTTTHRDREVPGITAFEVIESLSPYPKRRTT